MDGLRYSADDSYYRPGPVHTCFMFEHVDWWLGPLSGSRQAEGLQSRTRHSQTARANTGFLRKHKYFLKIWIQPLQASTSIRILRGLDVCGCVDGGTLGPRGECCQDWRNLRSEFFNPNSVKTREIASFLGRKGAVWENPYWLWLAVSVAWQMRGQKTLRLRPRAWSPGMGEGGDWWSWMMGVIAEGIPRGCHFE